MSFIYRFPLSCLVGASLLIHHSQIAMRMNIYHAATNHEVSLRIIIRVNRS